MAKPSLKHFLEVAFNSDEYIHTVARTAEGAPLNHRPRTLSRSQTEELEGISHGGGVFVCTNPVLPHATHKKADVTAVRNLVFESDTLPPDEQIALWKNHGIPYSAIVRSGGKSVHFWVCLDADIDEDTFGQYRALLLAYLDQIGFQPDMTTNDISRLMRFPTAFRGSAEQELVEVTKRISEHDFAIDFLYEVCPPLPKSKNQRRQQQGFIVKAPPDKQKTSDEAQAYCDERWPLETGLKQSHLLSWAIYLVANTNFAEPTVPPAQRLTRDDLVSLICAFDRGRNQITSEYEKVVDKAISMLGEE